jgi:integrase
MAVLSAIYNVGLLEFELDLKNPFSSQKIPDLLADAREVPSFTEDELRKIATAALAEKTTEALIAAMQIETGCRIREIAMLRTGDLHLDAEIPYVRLVQHLEHGRRIKTGKSGERVLPLIGVSLHAAQIAAEHGPGEGWLFDIGFKNPSSRINRWLSRTLGGKQGSHSFRHSMETRLILARTDQRLIDTILGHKTRGMGSVYFSGYSLADLAEALNKIALPSPG